jgi:hypothetical protein
MTTRSASLSWDEWELTNQAAADQCAEELYEAGFASNTDRGWNQQGVAYRKIEVHLPDPTPSITAFVGAGSWIVLLAGGVPEVLTDEQHSLRFPQE